ncbi:hypothetical protein DMN91_008309 [Ooceraea biroi]|uniref:Large ribosomal subunit protein uL29m n=2 Tax=Ooceraea biroi TaxID=2015173 RepID=A0A3L8DHT0_OOCBI|nr:39S ribosomal protein L47, mitochondrial [Ooceraea biroi]RLU19752.1 hypothetical protein DMN91_008309 [Ooceraea biroi]
MAVIIKTMQVFRSVNNITNLLKTLSLSQSAIISPKHVFLRSTPALHCAFLHITSERYDLMEFFDDPKHWAKNEVRVGRSWRRVELRLKSNTDLHKLWYVLLKERNMLMTMEEACKQANEIFPNPERLDKVEISMKNLERVVRERNTAYHMLETGETGERPGKLVYNRIGMKYFYRMTEHPIPIFMNKSWRKKNLFGFKERSVRKFLGFYREKLWNEKRKARNREKRRVAVILRRFPNVDLEALKEQFPNVDIKAAKASKVARGHYAPE